MPDYSKLRVFTDIEPCNCARLSQLLLVYTLTENPIHCYQCKGEVDPERIHLGDPQVESVFNWHRQFRALYDLWLASGEYETWAKAQLLNPQGQVNIDGLAAADALSDVLPAYYWWFHDEDDPVPTACPKCSGLLISSQRHGHSQCPQCRIII